jgi:hypothetical protein
LGKDHSGALHREDALLEPLKHDTKPLSTSQFL